MPGVIKSPKGVRITPSPRVETKKRIYNPSHDDRTTELYLDAKKKAVRRE